MSREPPIALSEQDGVRYLHFGTRWIQGAMRIRRPDVLELSYTREMMAWLMLADPPARILQLGLGAGSLTRFCLARMPQTEVTVVERSRSVIETCHAQFALPRDEPRLRIVRDDAGHALRRLDMKDAFNVVQIDLYDEHARGPVLESEPFYRACHASLETLGLLTVNLFGNEASFERSERRLRRIFDTVFVLDPVEEGNTVLLAVKGPPVRATRTQLVERAAHVERTWGLPAARWAGALAMQGSQA